MKFKKMLKFTKQYRYQFVKAVLYFDISSTTLKHCRIFTCNSKSNSSFENRSFYGRYLFPYKRKNSENLLSGKVPAENISKEGFLQALQNCRNKEEIVAFIAETKYNLHLDDVTCLFNVLCQQEGSCNHRYKCHASSKEHESRRHFCKKIISVIEKNIETVQDEWLVWALRCLKDFDSSSASHELLMKCENRIHRFSSETLANFSFIVENNFNSLVLQVYSVNLLDQLSLQCFSVDELQHLLTSAKNIKITSRRLLDRLIEKIKNFLDKNKLVDFQLTCDCLELLILRSNYGDLEYRTLMKSLCSILEEKIPYLKCDDLFHLHFVLRQIDLDIYELISKISTRADELIKDNITPVQQLRLLFCMQSQDKTRNCDKAYHVIEGCYKNMCFVCHGRLLLTVIHTLGYSHHPLLNTIWNDLIKHFGDELLELHACDLYVRFKISFHGTYRHELFEKSLKPILLNRISDSLHLFPSKYALAFSFLIITSTDTELPEVTINHFKTMLSNFNTNDLNLFFKSLDASARMQKSVKFREHLKNLTQLLVKEVSVRTPSINTLSEVSGLTSSFVLLQAVGDHSYFDDLMDRHQELISELSSKSLITICNNISATGYYQPILLEEIAHFLMKNDVTGWAAASVLRACYRIGWLPPTTDLLEKSIRLINKNWNSMTGLKILQSCLAVSLFHQLPSEWAEKVFLVSFLDKLDQEIQSGWTFSYSKRLKRYLLELNRIICLEYPEMNVPWFHAHDAYITAAAPVATSRDSTFHKEVEQFLIILLGENNFFHAHTYTPYSYHLSFECQLDRANNLVQYSKYRNGLYNKSNTLPYLAHLKKQTCFRRVAINLRHEKLFCMNVPNLVGGEQLKQRHLEILNYKVVNIPYFEWNSLALADSKSKLQYLKKKILN